MVEYKPRVQPNVLSENISRQQQVVADADYNLETIRTMRMRVMCRKVMLQRRMIRALRTTSNHPNSEKRGIQKKTCFKTSNVSNNLCRIPFVARLVLPSECDETGHCRCARYTHSEALEVRLVRLAPEN